MVGYYFDKKRSLATGIAVCGSSTGIFVLAPLASTLVNEFGWKGTNIILAGLILNGIVVGGFYRPLLSPASLYVLHVLVLLCSLAGL
jgi:predicted MFS family arabinose efflux permease